MLKNLHEARHWKTDEHGRVVCTLCPHNCKMRDGMTGICGVRKNVNGKLYTLIYGKPSSIALDPVEKKGLHHFYPGTLTYSLGTVGCNLGCSFCQNSSISQVNPDDIPLTTVSANQLPILCKKHNCDGVAWTYNEPIIWHEWAFDGAKELKKNGYYTIYKTNGFINEEPFNEIVDYIDGWSVDVKAWTNKFYMEICKARLAPVLQTAKRVYERKKHLEITYLIVPTLNDKVDEFQEFSNWVLNELSPDIPVHFTRFHPDFQLQHLPYTPMDTLLTAWNIAKKSGLKYVYLGNVPQHGEFENTYCPNCGALLIERYNFEVHFDKLKNNSCAKCGTKIPISGTPKRQVLSYPKPVF